MSVPFYAFTSFFSITATFLLLLTSKSELSDELGAGIMLETRIKTIFSCLEKEVLLHVYLSSCRVKSGTIIMVADVCCLKPKLLL